MKLDKTKFFAVKRVTGRLAVYRFIDDEDYENAASKVNVIEVTDPFHAPSPEDAEIKARKLI